MYRSPTAFGDAPIVALVAWVLIQGFVGFTSLYVFSALLPRFALDPTIGATRAGLVPSLAQAGLMVVFVCWQFLSRATDRRLVVSLLALLALATTAMSLAPSFGWLLVPTVLAGAGSLVWATIQTIVTALGDSATHIQWLGALMLASGALGRWTMLEVADAAGWRWALRALALVAACAALLLRANRFTVGGAPVRPVASGDEAPADGSDTLGDVGSKPRSPGRLTDARRRAAIWGAVTIALTGSALSALDAYEPAALHAATFAWAIGPLGFAYVLGGVIAALIVSALRQPRTAVVVAASMTAFGTLLDVVGAVALTGGWWLALLALGRLAVECGTTVFVVSLGAIVAERYGDGARYARSFAFWRAVASTAVGWSTIPLFLHGGWLAITLLALASALLALLAAVVGVRTILADPRPVGRHRRRVGRHRRLIGRHRRLAAPGRRGRHRWAGARQACSPVVPLRYPLATRERGWSDVD